MNMSKRLSTIVNLIDPCTTVADIGTDHAFIPIYLVKNQICSRAIASDVRAGPAEKARKNIVSFGLQKEIEVRIGPGLTTLLHKEAETIVIAGMGGELIKEILGQGAEVARFSQSLVLQPMTQHEHLRKWLYDNEYSIIDEDLAEEYGKIYIVMKVTSKPAGRLSESQLCFGQVLFQKKHYLLRKYIMNSISELEKIQEKLSGINTQRSRKRLDEVNKRIILFRSLIEKI